MHAALGLVMSLALLFWVVQVVTAKLDRRRQRRLQGALATLDHTPAVTVVVPVYNERYETLRQCVTKLLTQVGVLVDVILVDDGSTNSEAVAGIEMANMGVKIIRLPEHRGKRHAQAEGFKQARSAYIVTVDSDTFLEPNAILNLVAAAIYDKADAVCGMVKLHNEDQNWLTKVVSWHYWFAYFQERASQSLFGTVTCCSGAISLYKTIPLLAFLPEYLNQTFMGHTLNAGDDRFLTTLFLLSGRRVVWTPEAVGWTETPPGLLRFLRQQIRWCRSYLATVPYVFKRLADWSLPFGYFQVRQLYRYPYHALVWTCLVWSLAATATAWPLAVLGLSIMVIAFVKALVAFLYTDDLSAFLLVPYSPLSTVLMSVVMVVAVLTVRNLGWATRKI